MNKLNSLQQVDPYYKYKFYLKYISGYTSLLFLMLFLWSKLGITALFFITLFLLVVFPLITGIVFYIYIYIVQINFIALIRNLYIILYILPFYTVNVYLTSWYKKLILKICIACFILIFFLNYSINLSAGIIFIFLSVITVLIISIEKFIIYRLHKKSDQFSYILSCLNSKSAETSRLARKIISKKLSNNKKNYREILLNFLSNSSSKKLQTEIINLLMNLDNPPVKHIFNISRKNPQLLSILKKEIKENHKQNNFKIIDFLITTLNDNDFNKKRKAAFLLKGMQSETTVNKLISNIKTKETDIEIALEIIENIARKTNNNYLTRKKIDGKPTKSNFEFNHKVSLKFKNDIQKLISIIEKILIDEEDMWLRYQALKTLSVIHPNPQKLIPFIQKFTTDSQQLVKTEAKGLIRDIQNNK